MLQQSNLLQVILTKSCIPHLDAQKDLLDCDGWLPAFVLQQHSTAQHSTAQHTRDQQASS
jgi:hypothetical protein